MCGHLIPLQQLLVGGREGGVAIYPVVWVCFSDLSLSLALTTRKLKQLIISPMKKWRRISL